MFSLSDTKVVISFDLCKCLLVQSSAFKFIYVLVCKL
nr:MAG TPA: hypothetical protein [Caudoviricetes sp.]